MASPEKKKPPKNRGRGRLSTIDTLPEEAGDDIIWLNQELRDRKMLQVEILAKFNERLAKLGLQAISKGAFSRYSKRKAYLFHEMDETRRVSMELAEAMGVDTADKMTMAVAEMTKSAALKLLEKGRLTPQDVHFLSRAAKDAAAAQKISTDLRQQIAKEELAKIEVVASQVGVSDEMIAKMRSKFLGLQ